MSNKLQEARIAATMLRLVFLDTIEEHFPGLDEWHWYRAMDRVSGQPLCGPNEPHIPDAALAACEPIRVAHDAYIKMLHHFYLLRDGPNGVLGPRVTLS